MLPSFCAAESRWTFATASARRDSERASAADVAIAAAPAAAFSDMCDAISVV